MSTAETLGEQFIGTILNWGLLGVASLQTYFYFTSENKDRMWIRALADLLLVITIVVLDVVQTIFTTREVWTMLVANWGNTAIFVSYPWWSEIPLPILTGIIGALVEIFFAWRITVLRQTIVARCISAVIILLAIAQCVGVFIFAGQWVRDGPIKGIHSKASIFYNAKSKMHFMHTKTLLDNLIVQVIECGAIVTAVALAAMILLLVNSDPDSTLDPNTPQWTLLEQVVCVPKSQRIDIYC
ncbi:hypothetical protein H0H92_000920 [Tricholoma furcatifolium]|nr:hypothetical protein H0H92_000920 [Tricholoma furcatifolium]